MPEELRSRRHHAESKLTNTYHLTPSSPTAPNPDSSHPTPIQDYADTYGVSSNGDALSLKFVMSGNVGNRVYLLEDEEKCVLATEWEMLRVACAGIKLQGGELVAEVA